MTQSLPHGDIPSDNPQPTSPPHRPTSSPSSLKDGHAGMVSASPLLGDCKSKRRVTAIHTNSAISVEHYSSPRSQNTSFAPTSPGTYSVSSSPLPEKDERATPHHVGSRGSYSAEDSWADSVNSTELGKASPSMPAPHKRVLSETSLYGMDSMSSSPVQEGCQTLNGYDSENEEGFVDDEDASGFPDGQDRSAYGVEKNDSSLPEDQCESTYVANLDHSQLEYHDGSGLTGLAAIEEEEDGSGDISDTQPQEHNYAHDNIEDIMNIPENAIPHRLRHRRYTMSAEHTPTPDNLQWLKVRRAELEAEVQEQQQHVQEEAVKRTAGPRLSSTGSISLADPGLKDDQAVLTVDDAVGTDDENSNLQWYDKQEENEKPTTRDGLASSLHHLSPHSSDFIHRRTSLPADQHMLSGSSHDILTAASSTPGLLPSTSPTPAPIKPSAKDKHRQASPSKARRNASLPEEIAELVKDAQGNSSSSINDGEDASWEKLAEDAQQDQVKETEENREELARLREKDLKPMDLDMGPAVEGDTGALEGLVVLETEAEANPTHEEETDDSETEYKMGKLVLAESQASRPGDGALYALYIASFDGTWFTQMVRTRLDAWYIADFIRMRGAEEIAPEEEIETCVQYFLADPSRFIVSKDGYEDNEDDDEDDRKDVNQDDDDDDDEDDREDVNEESDGEESDDEESDDYEDDENENEDSDNYEEQKHENKSSLSLAPLDATEVDAELKAKDPNFITLKAHVSTWITDVKTSSDNAATIHPSSPPAEQANTHLTKVIAMLPKTFFWASVLLVAASAQKAWDRLVAGRRN